MQTTSEIMPKVLDQIPEPKPGAGEFQTRQKSISTHCSPLNPLRNDWQRRFIGLDAFCPAVQLMADAAQEWCGKVKMNLSIGRLLVVSGPFGCGKTQCLRATRRYINAIRMGIWPEAWNKPPAVESINFADFVREQVRNNNRDQMEDALAADVLFIDDAGSEEDEFKSGAPTRILGDMLGKLERRFVFITTNVPPNGWRERWDARVEDRLLRNESAVINLWMPHLRAESFSVWKRRQV